MCNKLISLACLLILVSCSQPKQSDELSSFSWTDFRGEVSLKGRVLDFDEDVMRPFSVQVFDSVLVTLEPAGDMVCQLFNLNTGIKIGDRLKKGEGPNEMLMPMFVNNGEGIQFIDLAMATAYKYDWTDFLNNTQPEPLAKCKLSEPVDSEMQMLGDNYVGYQYFKEQLLYLFDKSGNKVKPMAEFTEDAGSLPAEMRADAYQMGYVSNGKDKVAVAYYMTDILEIWNGDGELVKHLHGPENLEYSDNGKDAFFTPKNAGNQFLVLYNGRNRMEEGHNSSCTKLLSFSWDGTPLYVYTLDDPIFTYCVDVKKRKIYGVSTTPEYHIVEYTLPE
jgi:hypothetical protein